MDCSGLIQMVMQKWGTLLPRTATSQFKKGRPVAKVDLQEGDLVFFQNTYKKGISHVGIFIGDGKFVHAANAKKGVIVTPLDTPYYAHRFAGARRLTPTEIADTPVSDEAGE